MILGIGVIAWIYIEGHQERAPNNANRAASTDDVAASTPQLDAANRRLPAGDAAQLELNAMSQTFRHSTLLIAIRDAGFYCDDVVTAHESTVGVWIAGCMDMRGYKIEAAGAGRYRVEPIPHQVDAVF